MKYKLNTENGGFTPDKSEGPKGFIWRKADVRGCFVRHDQGGFVKEIPRDRIYLFS